MYDAVYSIVVYGKFIFRSYYPQTLILPLA